MFTDRVNKSTHTNACGWKTEKKKKEKDQSRCDRGAAVESADGGEKKTL